MAKKEKEARPMVTEFWLKDKRGAGGYILVNRFEGYIPVDKQVLIGGIKKDRQTYVSYHLDHTKLDILDGRFKVYLF